MIIKPINYKYGRVIEEAKNRQCRHLAMYDAYIAFKDTQQPIYDVVYRKKDLKGHTILADFIPQKCKLEKFVQKTCSLLFNKKYKPIRIEADKSTSRDIGRCIRFLDDIQNNKI